MFSTADLTNILSRFFPNTTGHIVEPFGAGLINDTYWVQVQDDQQEWLLQRLNHFVFRQPDIVMENIRRIADHLAAQNYRGVLLQPLPTSDGQLLYQDPAGNYWRVFPFFAKTFSIDQVADPEQVRLAGRAYGDFFHALAGLDPISANIRPTIPGFHDSVARMSVFEEVVAVDPAGRLARATPEVAAIRQSQSLFHEIAALGLPNRIVHNDTKINNVLFDRGTGQVRGVIDWDTIMPGTVLSDFGDMVRTMTPNYDENHRKTEEIEMVRSHYKALCQGFLPAVRSVILPIERENLVRGGQWITLEQALRFLTDYINGDVYYKTTFPEQNLLRARNQLALFESLRREERIVERWIREH